VDSKRKDISGLRRRLVQGSQALYLAEVAINQLKRIEANDPRSKEAGIEVIRWCARNLTGFAAALKAVRSPGTK